MIFAGRGCTGKAAAKEICHSLVSHWKSKYASKSLFICENVCGWASREINQKKTNVNTSGDKGKTKGFILNWKSFFACRRMPAAPLVQSRGRSTGTQGSSSHTSQFVLPSQPGWDAAAEMFVCQTPQLCSPGSAAWAHGQVLPLTHPRDSCSLWGAGRGKAFPPVLDNSSVFSTSLTIAAATDPLEAGKWKTKQTKQKNKHKSHRCCIKLPHPALRMAQFTPFFNLLKPHFLSPCLQLTDTPTSLIPPSFSIKSVAVIWDSWKSEFLNGPQPSALCLS